MEEKKTAVVNQLQKEILRLQGFKTTLGADSTPVDLGVINHAFPNGIFPIGTIHEFVSTKAEETAATCGFISGLVSCLMVNDGACLWISKNRTLFPPSLMGFGVTPDRVIFIDITTDKDLLWVMEEALKCGGLAAVIAEIPQITFTQSRRLQLAVEQSKVTGFMIRLNARNPGTTACTARWKISPLPSYLENGMPGVGYPRWQVELLRVRNGHTGSWKMEWLSQRFSVVADTIQVPFTGNQQLNVG